MKARFTERSRSARKIREMCAKRVDANHATNRRTQKNFCTTCALRCAFQRKSDATAHRWKKTDRLASDRTNSRATTNNHCHDSERFIDPIVMRVSPARSSVVTEIRLTLMNLKSAPEIG